MIIIGYDWNYEFWILDISMVTTQGQENNDKEASSSQRGNSVEQLARWYKIS